MSHGGTAQPDSDIVRLLEAGDVAAAFALVMARYQGKVYRLCVATLRDATLAQDVAQESLVRVWRALPRYDGRAALSTFIYVIARNRCLTALRTRGSGSSLRDTAVQPEAAELPASAMQAGRDTGYALRQLVNELDDPTRRIVLLYYFEDGSVTEVAALVGMPEGTVKTHLLRARQRLRRRLQELDLYDRAVWNEG